MDLMNINFKEVLSNVKKGLICILGEEYQNIIEERLNNTFVLQYNNLIGTIKYYNLLIEYKQKELCIRYLKEIGIIPFSKNIDVREPLDEEITRLIIKHFGSIKNSFQNHNDFYKRIRSQKEKQLDSCIKIYEKLCNEFEDYLKQLSGYQEYLEREAGRLNEIVKAGKIELLNFVYDMLPDSIKKELDSKKTPEDKADYLFDKTSYKKSNFGPALPIISELDIEYFNSKYQSILDDNSISYEDKIIIYVTRANFLKRLGANIDINGIYDNTRILNNAMFKDLILSASLADKISEKYKEIALNGKRKFIFESDYFIRIIGLIGDSQSNRENIFKYIKNKKICITAGYTKQDDFIRLLFICIPGGRKIGSYDYIMLHECIHAVTTTKIPDNNDYRCGLEMEKSSLNSYNNKYRKYERLNETITDILALETLNFLHMKGIYLFEPICYTNQAIADFNTSRILKNMIKPLFDTFRKEIIAASITGDYSILFVKIGKENFDTINDCINKVDYLISIGLEDKLDEANPLVKSFNEAISRLNEVYAKISFSSLVSIKNLIKK